MNTPSAVGWVYMFCCGTNAAERRISLPVAASSTYTNPVFPASAYFAESAFSLAMSRFRSSPSGVVLENGPHQPPSSGDGSVYHVHPGAPVVALKDFT